jgi:hypothetical protein
MKFAGEKIEGKSLKLFQEEKQRFEKWQSYLKPGRYIFDITQERQDSSPGQRGYFHGYVLPFLASELWGDETQAEKMRERLKELFLFVPKHLRIEELLKDEKDYKFRQELREKFNNMSQDEFKKYERVYSESELNTLDFEIWMEKIRRWSMVEFKIYVKLPREY